MEFLGQGFQKLAETDVTAHHQLHSQAVKHLVKHADSTCLEFHIFHKKDAENWTIRTVSNIT